MHTCIVKNDDQPNPIVPKKKAGKGKTVVRGLLLLLLLPPPPPYMIADKQNECSPTRPYIHPSNV